MIIKRLSYFDRIVIVVIFIRFRDNFLPCESPPSSSEDAIRQVVVAVIVVPIIAIITTTITIMMKTTIMHTIMISDK